MSGTIRAFVAIELPPEVKAGLATMIAEIDRASVAGVRLVRPEGIHLTLQFLGDISAELVERVVAAVSRVSRAHNPFTLNLGGAGAFPSRSSPRVLWVGVEGEQAALASLRQDIEDALEPLGFARDDREFTPHLTVRLEGRASAADRRRVTQGLFSATVEPGPRIDVDSISLMQSTLLPDGAVYERLASMPLAGETSPELR